MKVAVIGAGISGLAFAKYASTKKNTPVKVKVFERGAKIGGIAKVKMVADNIPFHMVGGHCFNSKHQSVKDFVFNHVLPVDQWRKIDRHATILFKGNRVNYPIEYSVREIFKFNPELALFIVSDFFKADKTAGSNLEEWFENNFGYTLAHEYFIPYNRKIWGVDPSSMTSDWVIDKLPVPNEMEIMKGLVDHNKDTMPHSSFYYPLSGTQNTFIDALSEDIDIILNSEIDSVSKRFDGTYVINGEIFDHVVYTGALDQIGDSFSINSPVVIDSLDKLRYNKVTTAIWKSKETEDTWTYIPDSQCVFHRMIHIGNFIGSNQNYTITEAVGEVSYERILESGKGLDQLIELVDYNVSGRAYVIFDRNIKVSKKVIFEYFQGENIHLLGRFGEWDYYNMDICIERAMKLFDSLYKEG